jgi:O-antigen/teichoic acid export membrane protein
MPRFGRRHYGTALADQIVSSASNFLVGVAVGRFGGAEQLGNYSIVFVIWLIVIGLNRAALTEPLVIFTDDLDDRSTLAKAARAQFSVALLMGGVLLLLGAGFVSAGVDLGRTVLALALALPILFAQDFWRAVGFGVHRPVLALVNDTVFIVVQLALTGLFIALDLTTAAWFILAWAGGAGAGALVGFLQFRTRPSVRPSFDVVREHWATSRWMVADYITLTGVRELQLLLVSLLLPRPDAGGLRAAESLMGPSVVVKLSGGNVGLPVMSREYREHGYRRLMHVANRFTLWVSLAQWLYCAGMLVFGPWLITTVYGEEFAQYDWVVYVIALQYAIGVVNFGPSIAVKVAAMMNRMWLMRTLLAAITLPAAVFIAARYGLVPTVWFSVATAALMVIANYSVFLPSIHDRLWPGDRATVPWHETTTPEADEHVRNRG